MKRSGPFTPVTNEPAAFEYIYLHLRANLAARGALDRSRSVEHKFTLVENPMW